MGSTDQLEDKIDRLEEKIGDLRSELHMYEAENIELEMELTQLKNENDDLHAEVARVKRLQAKTEADRKKCSAKYNNLLDDLSMSENDLEKELAYYKRKSDDLEETLKDERKAWQKTLKVLTEENDEYRLQKTDLLESLDDKKHKLEDERKRNRDLEDDLEAVTRAKEDAEQAFREQELKTARLMNEHTGLNIKVWDMYIKQRKYKNQIRTMSSRDLGRDSEFTNEALSNAMRNMMHDEDSYNDDRSHKEDDYKSSRYGDDRGSDHERRSDHKRKSDRYETRGRSPTPEWG